MDMGYLFFTQANPTHQLTDLTQPIVPAHEPTQPTHLTAMQIKASEFNPGVAQEVVNCFF